MITSTGIHLDAKSTIRARTLSPQALDAIETVLIQSDANGNSATIFLDTPAQAEALLVAAQVAAQNWRTRTGMTLAITVDLTPDQWRVATGAMREALRDVGPELQAKVLDALRAMRDMGVPGEDFPLDRGSVAA